jgi:uncharacterized membrane protein YqgA involved in biofilm formation
VGSVLPRGTLLNTATVALGGLIGWAAGARIPESYQELVFSGLGIVTVGLGLKMLLGSKNILVVAAAIALGGMIGMALGFQEAVANMATWMKTTMGVHDDAGFVDVLITTSVLFCVGPMTLLGCMQDRLEGKIELLALKSTMDGVGAIFFAVKSGPAVLATALVVLVVQSAITFAAKPLRPLSEDDDLLAELSAAGGVMLVGTGLGLLAIKSLPVANYLPALVLAPLFVVIGRRFTAKRATIGKA